jgi:Fe-S-cluster containining protein
MAIIMENRDKADRIIYECKQCGHCCHGIGTVAVTPEEQEKMAEYLGLSLAELTERYLLVRPHRTEMKVVDGHCIFYGDDGLCKVHPVKPFHCRRWPLHPSILHDEQAWKAIKADCPGFSEDATWQDACRLVKEAGYGS